MKLILISFFVPVIGAFLAFLSMDMKGVIVFGNPGFSLDLMLIVIAFFIILYTRPFRFHTNNKGMWVSLAAMNFLSNMISQVISCFFQLERIPSSLSSSVIFMLLCVFSHFSFNDGERKEDLFIRMIKSLGIGFVRIKGDKIEMQHNMADSWEIEKGKAIFLEKLLEKLQPYDLSTEVKQINKMNEAGNSLVDFFGYIQELNKMNKFVKVGQVSVTSEKERQYELIIRFDEEAKETDVLLFDVTLASQKEKELTESKMRQLFLAKMAHEILNPLLSIESKAQQLTELTETAKDDVFPIIEQILQQTETISTISRYLVNLVHDFNTYSLISRKSQLTAFEATDLSMSRTNTNEFLDFVVKLANSKIVMDNKGDKVFFRTNFTNLPEFIVIDQIKLKQVLINLITNAIKFSVKGIVELSVRSEQLIENKTKLEFIVKDSGFGMTHEQLSRLLSSEERQVPQYGSSNAGLGLLVVKRNLDLMKSELRLSSILGEQTEVKFSLVVDYFEEKEETSSDSREETVRMVYRNERIKVDDNEETQLFRKETLLSTDKTNKTKFSNSRNSRNEKTNHSFAFENNFLPDLKEEDEYDSYVLVCDDDEFVLKTYLKMLEKLEEKHVKRIKVIIARDGIDCLWKVRETAKNGGHFDLLIIDETMPFLSGSNTIELLNNIMQKKEVKKFPIVSVTAYFDESTMEDIKKKFANDVFNKPLNLKKLEEILVTYEILDLE